MPLRSPDLISPILSQMRARQAAASHARESRSLIFVRARLVRRKSDREPESAEVCRFSCDLFEATCAFIVYFSDFKLSRGIRAGKQDKNSAGSRQAVVF